MFLSVLAGLVPEHLLPEPEHLLPELDHNAAGRSDFLPIDTLQYELTFPQWVSAVVLKACVLAPGALTFVILFSSRGANVSVCHCLHLSKEAAMGVHMSK